MTEDEEKSIRDVAYAVCTGTSHDPEALHYYRDLARKMACVQGKSCAGVSVCLTTGDMAGTAAPN